MRGRIFLDWILGKEKKSGFSFLVFVNFSLRLGVGRSTLHFYLVLLSFFFKEPGATLPDFSLPVSPYLLYAIYVWLSERLVNKLASVIIFVWSLGFTLLGKSNSIVSKKYRWIYLHANLETLYRSGWIASRLSYDVLFEFSPGKFYFFFVTLCLVRSYTRNVGIIWWSWAF